MPKIAPITLNIGGRDEVFQPTTHDGKRTQFVDSSSGRLANWRIIRVDVRPAGQGNAGHLVEALLVRPNPVEDQDGCCVDRDNAPASTITIKTLLHKTSTPAQADDLVKMLGAFVADSGYQAAIKGAGYY